LPAVKSLLVRARISLVESVEARDTDCIDIRTDLADAFDRGVRTSGLARRHLRDCPGCVEYRTQLRFVREGLNALSPGGGPMAAVLKLVGLGGAGSAGAASAGGGAAAGGGAIAAVGTGTAAKVAAVVCCAALTAGGAVEVGTHMKPSHPAPAAAGRQAAPIAAPHTAAAHAQRPAAAAGATATRSSTRSATATRPADEAAAPTPGTSRGTVGGDVTQSAADPQASDAVTGGAAAPNEDTGFGHGVDGLTPVTAGKSDPAPDAGSSSGAPTPASGGYAAPPAESSAVTAPALDAGGKVQFVPGSPPAG
jgi:hypothetical protein